MRIEKESFCMNFVLMLEDTGDGRCLLINTFLSSEPLISRLFGRVV